MGRHALPYGEIAVGDAVDGLRSMPAGSARCCVTSPPYFGLRDYGTGHWEGGDTECDHRKPGERRQLPHGDGRANDSYANERVLIAGVGAMYTCVCGKCGARRVDRQIGLEDTPDAYVARLVDVFREVRRVLADDGTLWLNIGDSYNAYNGNRGASTSFQAATEGACPRLPGGAGLTTQSAKNKDLIGIPWMLAFALRADGWYLRSDIVWAKPNPMPESVTDRPTRSHEYVFLLTKSARYYYNAGAIAEPVTESTVARLSQNVEAQTGSARANGGAKTNGNIKACGGRMKKQDELGKQTYTGFNARWTASPTETRNKRDVWSIATQPFSEAHFATFPPALVTPCILAGSEQGDTVLDPFGGSGTTGMVAVSLGRRFALCELNPDYALMAKRRIGGANPALLMDGG